MIKTTSATKIYIETPILRLTIWSIVQFKWRHIADLWR